MNVEREGGAERAESVDPWRGSGEAQSLGALPNPTESNGIQGSLWGESFK